MNSQINGTWFQIESKSISGLVLDVEGEKRGGRIVLLPRRNDRITQLWTWKENTLLNFKGYILDMQGGYSASGTFATAFDDYDGKNQKWKIKEDRIVSKLNELTLDISISPSVFYPCIKLQPVSSQSRNAQSWWFLSADVTKMLALNTTNNIETSKPIYFETMSVIQQSTLTKNCQSVPLGPKYSEPLSANDISNTNHDSIKMTDVLLSENRNIFINNFSIMQTFNSEATANDATDEYTFNLSLPNIFYQKENHEINIDLQDWYFDDEFQPSLQNDPNMQLISSHGKELDNVASFQSSSIFEDTDSILSMDLSDEDPCFSTNESDYEENYNSCGN